MTKTKLLRIALTCFVLFTLIVSFNAPNSITTDLIEIITHPYSLSFHLLVDLYLLNLIFMSWMAKDARQMGLSSPAILGYIILTFSLVSIGVLVYLLHRNHLKSVQVCESPRH